MNDWLERSVNQAWEIFESDLACQVASLTIDETLLIQTSQIVDQKASSCIAVGIIDSRHWEVGYEVLATSPRLEPKEVDADLTRLMSLGFTRFTVDQVMAHLPDPIETARMIIRALRSGLAQLHPSYLNVSFRDGAGNEPLDRPQHIQTQADLKELITSFVIGYYDDAYIEPGGPISVWVRDRKIQFEPIADTPIVHISTVLIDDVQDISEAAKEIARINSSTLAIQLRIRGNQIVALLPVFTWPAIGRHLITGCEMLVTAASQLPQKLAHLGYLP